MKQQTAPFCINSNRWLDFMPKAPKTCRYDRDWTACDACGYCEERPVTAWYRRKRRILESYGETE